MKPLTQKDRIQLLITVVAVCGFVVYWVAGRAKDRTFTSPAAGPAEISVEAGTDVPFYVRLQEKARSMTVSRDPFTAGESAKKVNGGPVLAGILYEEDDPTAIINGQVVKPGMWIDNYRVEAITPASVTLSRDGQKKILSLQ